MLTRSSSASSSAFVVLGVVLGALASCKDKPSKPVEATGATTTSAAPPASSGAAPIDSAAAAASASAAVSAAAAGNEFLGAESPAAALAGIDGGGDPRFGALSIVDRLAVEKTHRLKAQPSVEDVFDGITKTLKIDFDRRKQVAAWPVGATYCELGETKLSNIIVVCEYASHEAMVKGTKTAGSTNKVIKGREVLPRKTSWISIQQPSTEAGAAEELKKMRAFIVKL